MNAVIPSRPRYRMSLTAVQPGEYRGECAEYCGEQHAHMIILVVAQPLDQFESWRKHQLEPASEPTDPEAIRGKELFMSRPCTLCHEIRGTLAQGGVAPDLTHFASRKGLAANMLANDDANLGAWVTHAQSLNPGVAMPNITEFSGEELRAIIAYLRQLR